MNGPLRFVKARLSKQGCYQLDLNILKLTQTEWGDFSLRLAGSELIPDRWSDETETALSWPKYFKLR